MYNLTPETGQMHFQLKFSLGLFHNQTTLQVKWAVKNVGTSPPSRPNGSGYHDIPVEQGYQYVLQYLSFWPSKGQLYCYA